jgi:hypothetical protein
VLWEGSSWTKLEKSRGKHMERANSFISSRSRSNTSDGMYGLYCVVVYVTHCVLNCTSVFCVRYTALWCTSITPHLSSLLLPHRLSLPPLSPTSLSPLSPVPSSERSDSDCGPLLDRGASSGCCVCCRIQVCQSV